ncbi:MAG: twin-arginine translocation signal domain-containing protein, partial [Desulfomonilaceae bacterium]
MSAPWDLRKLTRRCFLRAAGAAVAFGALAACQPRIVKETVVVEKEKVVAKEKEVTKVVEKEVTKVV